jgi:anaerobic sulfite reductase subunit A
METNRNDEYDAYLKVDGDNVYVDVKDGTLENLLKADETLDVKPNFVTENNVSVSIPENLSLDVMKSEMWKEYSARCIACGRCNFVCPTCTCFTMQDVFYTDNGKAGERRRVWASCHVDGFTNMAGGHSFRLDKGQRMRFKVLHKVHDYKKKWGYHMCVGCGRCDDICPEYISFSNCVNKLNDGMKEVSENE